MTAPKQLHRSRTGLTQTWEDSEKLFYKTVSEFRSRYGLPDFDDIKSEGLEHFVLAYYEFDPERSAWTTWMRYRVLCGLKARARHMAKRRARATIVPLRGDVVERTKDRYQTLLDTGLSEDGRFVALLATDPPADVRLTLASSGRRKPTPNAWRRALSEYLRDIGWSCWRIARAFVEVRRAVR